MHRYWDDMDGSMGMNPMSQFITRPRVSIPDDARKEQAKTWDFIWDDAGACWRCWRCLVTVQQFKNLKRHFGGVKCRQRSRTLACQSSRQMLRAGGFKVRYAGAVWRHRLRELRPARQFLIASDVKSYVYLSLAC